MLTRSADPAKSRELIDGARALLADLDDPEALDLLAHLRTLTKPLEPPRRLRQSLLSNYDACNLQARLSLVHEAGWSTHDQARGKVFHRVAARCLELMAQYGDPHPQTGQYGIEVEQALEVLDDVIRQADVDRECPSCGDGKTEPVGGGRYRCLDPECGRVFASDFGALPVEQIAQLRISVKTWANNNRFDVDNLVSVEERIRVPITYEREDGTRVERVLSGAVDALFFSGDRAIVLDWKDTWALPAGRDEDEDDAVSFEGYFQQRFYAFLVMSKYPAVESVTMREHYPRYTEFREATIDRDAMPELEAELSALAERFDRSLEDDVWTPSPGKHCGFCPRPTACPIFPDVRGEGAIEGEDMARRYAAELAVAKTAYQSRQKSLKAYANIHGPVPLADAKGKRAYGFVPTTTNLGPKPDDVKREIALASIEGREPNVDALWRKRPGTRFDQFVPAPTEVTDHDRDLERQLQESLARLAK